MKTCARCGLVNPDTATSCDCGFDLVHGNAKAMRGVMSRRGWWYMASGAALVVLGLLGGMTLFPIHFTFVITLGTHAIDGAMVVVGAVLVARGIRILDRR